MSNSNYLPLWAQILICCVVSLMIFLSLCLLYKILRKPSSPVKPGDPVNDETVISDVDLGREIDLINSQIHLPKITLAEVPFSKRDKIMTIPKLRRILDENKTPTGEPHPLMQGAPESTLAYMCGISNFELVHAGAGNEGSFVISVDSENRDFIKSMILNFAESRVALHKDFAAHIKKHYTTSGEGAEVTDDLCDKYIRERLQQLKAPYLVTNQNNCVLHDGTTRQDLETAKFFSQDVFSQDLTPLYLNTLEFPLCYLLQTSSLCTPMGEFDENNYSVPGDFQERHKNVRVVSVNSFGPRIENAETDHDLGALTLLSLDRGFRDNQTFLKMRTHFIAKIRKQPKILALFKEMFGDTMEDGRFIRIEPYGSDPYTLDLLMYCILRIENALNLVATQNARGVSQDLDVVIQHSITGAGQWHPRGKVVGYHPNHNEENDGPCPLLPGCPGIGSDIENSGFLMNLSHRMMAEVVSMSQDSMTKIKVVQCVLPKKSAGKTMGQEQVKAIGDLSSRDSRIVRTEHSNCLLKPTDDTATERLFVTINPADPYTLTYNEFSIGGLVGSNDPKSAQITTAARYNLPGLNPDLNGARVYTYSANAVLGTELPQDLQAARARGSETTIPKKITA